MNRASRSLAVAWACGLILVAAVVLKLQGAMVGGASQSLGHLSSRAQIVGMEFEAVVGLWLVSGLAPRGAWCAAVWLYTMLAGVSIYLGWAGVNDCGCFGRVSLSPWGSFALDAACLAALAWARPVGLWEWLRRPGKAAPRVAAAGAALTVLLLLGASTAASRQFARLRGEAIVFPGDDADAGAGQPDEHRWVKLAVENISDHEVRLIGGTADCACLATYDLPMTIPPGRTATLRVSVRYTGGRGNFKHAILWYTDAPTQPHLAAYVTGRVEASPHEI